MLPIPFMFKPSSSTPLVLQYTNPYTYVAAKFTATSDWLFGRTKFIFNISAKTGTPVASSMVIYDTLGNTLDITNGASTVFGSPNWYVIWEPTGGADPLVNGTQYWIAFTIASGGTITMVPGVTQCELLYTNGSPSALAGTGTPVYLSFSYTA